MLTSKLKCTSTAIFLRSYYNFIFLPNKIISTNFAHYLGYPFAHFLRSDSTDLLPSKTQRNPMFIQIVVRTYVRIFPYHHRAKEPRGWTESRRSMNATHDDTKQKDKETIEPFKSHIETSVTEISPIDARCATNLLQPKASEVVVLPLCYFMSKT